MTLNVDEHHSKLWAIYHLGRKYEAFSGDLKSQDEIANEVETLIDEVVQEFDW